MYAYGTDLTQLPYTDTMQKNPLYNPNQQQQQTRNTKKNNQQWGEGNWAYSQSPSPAGGSKAPDMSAWGKAQPIPPPSRGTPYGGDMAAWSSPQQARDALGVNPVNFGNGMWGAPGGEPLSPRPPVGFGAPKPMSQDFGAFSPPTFTYGEQQSPMGNWGNSQYGRPQGFQASYFDMQGNPVSAEQQQAQRAAMVLQLHQAQLPYVLGNAMNQNLGKPQFDFNTMLQSANEAVKNGFYNPFQRFYEEQDAIQRLGQQAPPSMYQAPTDPTDWSLPYNDTPVLRKPADYGIDWSIPGGFVPQNDGPAPTPGWRYGGDMTAPQQSVLTQKPVGEDNSGLTPAQLAMRQGFKDYIESPPRTQKPQWKPMYGEYSPTVFYDDNGREFAGSMSFAPGTSAEEQDEAYRRFAESSGFYNRDSNGNPIGASQPVNVSEGYTSEPVPPWMRPGAARPVAPPSTGTPYGWPLVLPAPDPAKKPARPQAPEQPTTYNPAQQDRTQNDNRVAEITKQYYDWYLKPAAKKESPEALAQRKKIMGPSWDPDANKMSLDAYIAQQLQYDANIKAGEAQGKEADERHQQRLAAQRENETRNKEAARREWEANVIRNANTVDMIPITTYDKFGRKTGYKWTPAAHNTPMASVPRGSVMNYKPQTPGQYAELEQRRLQQYYATPEGRAHAAEMKRMQDETRKRFR